MEVPCVRVIESQVLGTICALSFICHGSKSQKIALQIEGFIMFVLDCLSPSEATPKVNGEDSRKLRRSKHLTPWKILETLCTASPPSLTPLNWSIN
jgi:hypothetical protein